MPASSQRGGFFLGMVVGLLVGLALALGVALYVTKVPVPFINKVPQRTAEQDAAEAERNRNWDPNAPLAGKNPAARAASAPVGPGGGQPSLPGAQDLPAVTRPAAPAASAPGALARTAPPAASAPGDKAAVSTAPAGDAFVYFVQAGAYARNEEAEAQRAKLAIQGYESKITEREQSGRIVYRVRVGPFTQRADAEGVKEKLDGAGMEAALVRVQK